MVRSLQAALLVAVLSSPVWAQQGQVPSGSAYQLESEYSRVNAAYKATKRDCEALLEELMTYVGPVDDPLAPRDEACAGLKVYGMAPSQNPGWAGCSDSFFEDYEAKRSQYRRCFNEEDRLGQERLDTFRKLTASRRAPAARPAATSRPAPAVASNQPGWLGVEISPVSQTTARQLGMAAPKGAYVEGTFTGSPARLGGLLRGDIIVGFGGQEVASQEDLLALAQDIRAGQNIAVDVLRNGQRQTINVMISARP